MITSKIKKWGNSLGLLIPKDELRRMGIGEDEEVIVEIIKKENPLKELFGFGKKKRIIREEFLEVRALLEEGNEDAVP